LNKHWLPCESRSLSPSLHPAPNLSPDGPPSSTRPHCPSSQPTASSLGNPGLTRGNSPLRLPSLFTGAAQHHQSLSCWFVTPGDIRVGALPAEVSGLWAPDWANPQAKIQTRSLAPIPCALLSPARLDRPAMLEQLRRSCTMGQGSQRTGPVCCPPRLQLPIGGRGLADEMAGGHLVCVCVRVVRGLV